MNGGTHSVGGLIIGLQLANGLHLEPAQMLIIAGAAALGALLPDIDMPASSIGRKVRLVSRPLALVVRHRGPTHSLIALAVVAVVAMHFHPLYGLALAAGYGSHLVEDMMTRSGVMLVWPARVFVHLLPRPLRLRTGGTVEKVLLFLMLVWLVWMVDQIRRGF